MYRNSDLGYPTKLILPSKGRRASIVIDNDYLALLQPGNERVDLCFGNEKKPFNYVRFAECVVMSEHVRSMAIFAHTVIFEDVSLDCEDVYFNVKNELEVRSGKLRFSTMKVSSKWINIESPSLVEGSRLIVTSSKAASLSGEFNLENQLWCRSPEISLGKDCSVAAGDVLLLPSVSLEILGKLRYKKLFIGDFDEKRGEVVDGSAIVRVSGEVEGERASILTSSKVKFSGEINVNELDCMAGQNLHVEDCRLRAKKLRVHALKTCVDSSSVLEGSEFSFLVEDKVEVGDLSSFRVDRSLVIECGSLVSGVGVESTGGLGVSRYRWGDVSISATESIELGGELKCRQLILNSRLLSAEITIRKNSRLDVDSLLVIGKRSNGNEKSESTGGVVVFEEGSEVLCSKFLGIETENEVVIKGSVKRGLCYSPRMSIKTSKSIKFVDSSLVDVGESQLLFGDEVVLDDRAKVHISGRLFILNHLKGVNKTPGVLRLARGCELVARKEIVCQFEECYIEGTFASEEESILLGQNNNQNSGGQPGTVEKDVRIDRVVKKVVEALKPSSKPLKSLFNKVQEKSIELIQSIQNGVVNVKEEQVSGKSFVMEHIFIAGEIRAKKTVMLVSRDIAIQNGSSIKCTSEWDSSAILMYSNRSVFQCSSELEASTVLIVSPIVFQLLSLIKAHNLSISAAVVFRLGCLCNSTKTILKSPLILSGLNVVAPNVGKTLHKMRSDLVENFVEVVMLIERLAEARMEHREFDVFLVESLRLFKKHSHLAFLHSLELVHFVFQIVNLLVPQTALIITVNVMSTIRAALFLLFSVNNIQKSIKRYLKSERHNFILVEIVGEGMFAMYQASGVVTSFVSLFAQIKNIRSSGMESWSASNQSLKGLPGAIVNRTKDLVSSGPLSALSNVLGVFDTFVLNDYTKYAVGLFSFLPSSMSFSILNLSGEMQLGMYVVNNSSTCCLNGSVVVLSYNCSSTNLVSVNTRSNVVICNGSISESSVIGKVDRGVKISQRSLVLTGGSRVHAGGFHFGESVVLKTRRFDQKSNRLIYNQIGGLSINKWKLHRSEFRPLLQSHSEAHTSTVKRSGGHHEAFDSGFILESVDESVRRSGNVVDSVHVGERSVFFLKNTALKVNSIIGTIAMKNVQAKVSCLKKLPMLQISGGNNSIVSDSDLDVQFSVHLSEGGNVNIISPSTKVNGETSGEGHVAFYNAEIGENANIQHTGSTLLELKSERVDQISGAICGSGRFSKIANDGQVIIKVNGEFRISTRDNEKLFLSESTVRERQDIGIIAESIDISREVSRKKGIQLLSLKEDVVVRESISSEDGSVVINAKRGNVLIEDKVEKGIVVTKCRLGTKSSPGNQSRLELDSEKVTPSYQALIIVDDVVDIVKNVEKVELRAEKGSVIISASEGHVILDPCIIHGEESVVVEGKNGVLIKDICVTSVTRKASRNPFYSKRKKVIKGVAETTSITSCGDISINSVAGRIETRGLNLSSIGGRILQSGRDGVVNESAVTKTSIDEKIHVLGGLSREQRTEMHEVEAPCVFESTEGIYVESERGSIVNVGMVATGYGVFSFKAEKNVVFERRILNHEVSVKKQGFDLSLSILGADIFESSSSFFDSLKMEFLENHLPPIGNSPIEVARSVKEGNVPEIAANLANALLIPGNLRFILETPVKFGLRFNDYDFRRNCFDTLGEGIVETDYLYIKAVDTVEFSNAFGFNAECVEIEASRLIEHGAYLNFELEHFSSGLGLGFEPIGGVLHCVPSVSVDLSIVKEVCSIAACQVGNTALMKVNVDEWEKSGSQTFAETVEGRASVISFDSASTVAEGKRHGFSLGTTSLGLSDGHSKSSFIGDQTGLYAVNVGDFHVKNVVMRSSRCPLGGTNGVISAEESIEYEKVSGTSLGVDFSNFISLSGVVGGGGGGKSISKLKGVGIERKDYMAVVQNSFESVSESEFHYRANDSSYSEAEKRESEMDLEKSVHESYELLNRYDNSTFIPGEGVETTDTNMSTLLQPLKKVLKDRGFSIKFHYDLNYHVLRDGIEMMHKEVVDEGLLPCLEGAAFEDVDPLVLYPVLDIFYDPSVSELDKYTQLLFYEDGERRKYSDLSEEAKQEVFIYQSFLEDGGDFRDFVSLCSYFDEKKQDLNDEYAKKSMKEYVRETYPELYLSTGLHNLQNVEEVRRVFMDIKLSCEPDDPMVRQLTFEIDQYYADQLYNASWAELSSAQQKEIVRIREHALMYQQTEHQLDVGFSEYVTAKEIQFSEYFANHHQEPDTSCLTSFGILPIELLKEPSPIVSECMPYQAPQLDSERKYLVPGSGLFFLIDAPEKGGLEGLCEYFSSVKNCFVDYLSYALSGRPEVDCQPSQRELIIDKSLRSFFSGVLDFVPYVNGVKWGFQGIAGFDPITKGHLDWSERAIDLTFSMFYLPLVGNVIIGYAKGAVWEPLKGTWNVGRILVKDRTFKGVLETMKATGVATIDSIAVPTLQLGMFVETKLLWGVSSGGSSFRSASAWFSEKMNMWKSGFSRKWKWYGRHYDVMTSPFSATGRNFAFAGGGLYPTTTGIHPSGNNQHPFMRFAEDGTKFGSKKGGSSYEGAKGTENEDVLKKDLKVKNVNEPSLVRETSLTSRLATEQKGFLVEIVAEKFFEKLCVLWESGKTDVKYPPKLEWHVYETIAKRFNGESFVAENPKLKKTGIQVKNFRTANRRDIYRVVQEKIIKHPEYGPPYLSKKWAEKYEKEPKVVKGYVAGNRLNIQEHRDILIDLISEKMFEKLCVLWESGIRTKDIPQLPELSKSDYKTITKQFNKTPSVRKSPNVKRTDLQVFYFRHSSKRTKEIFEAIQGKIEKHPKYGPSYLFPELPGSSLLQNEHRIILVEMVSEKIFEKLRGLWKSGKTGVEDLPNLSDSEYDAIAKRFNAESIVVGNPRRFSRNGQQVKYFRRHNKKEISETVQSKIENHPEYGSSFQFSERSFSLLSGKQRMLVVDLMSEKVFEKLRGLWASGKSVQEIKKLPRLFDDEYRAIAAQYNADPIMKKSPHMKRNAQQLKNFYWQRRDDIFAMVQEKIEKHPQYGPSFLFPKIPTVGFLKEEHKVILMDILARKMFEKYRVLWDSGKTEIKTLPRLSTAEYEEIAQQFNSDPTLSSDLKRTGELVRHFRNANRKVIFGKIQAKIEKHPQYGGSIQLSKMPSVVHLLRGQPKRILSELISVRIFEKLRGLWDSGKTDIYNTIPNLSARDYETITKQFNADPVVIESGLKRNDQQIKLFRKSNEKAIFEMVQAKVHENPEYGHDRSVLFDQMPKINEARVKILVELLSEKMFEKLRSFWDSGGKKRKSVYSKTLPRLSDLEYEEVAMKFNANPVVSIKPHLEWTHKEVKIFRFGKKRDIFKKVREIIEDSPGYLRYTLYSPSFLHSEMPVVGRLSAEHRDLLVDAISEKLFEKLRTEWEAGKGIANVQVLPELSFNDYESIANTFNQEPSITERLRRTGDQVKCFERKSRNRREIFAKLQEKIEKHPSYGPSFLFSEIPVARRGRPAIFLEQGNYSEILIDMISEKIFEKYRMLWDCGKTQLIKKLPSLSAIEYNAIAEEINAKLSLKRKLKRTIPMVRHFRAVKRQEILDKIQERIQACTDYGPSFMITFLSIADAKNIVRPLRGEARKMLVEFLSEKIFVKDRSSWISSSSTSSSNTSSSGNTKRDSINKERRFNNLPRLSEKDYKTVTKQFNSAIGDPRLQRTVQQVKNFRSINGKDIRIQLRKIIDNFH